MRPSIDALQTYAGQPFSALLVARRSVVLCFSWRLAAGL
jgi:hypothetical protein